MRIYPRILMCVRVYVFINKQNVRELGGAVLENEEKKNRLKNQFSTP